ncbi:methyltransferase domain-containing protein [Rhodobacter capsulatus]|uniref:methyltransferase domain-containing protein n=1 Tax=Rhodobacter capsulatus TaxID=1061 RepID=UPI0003D33B63|nr:methyltransferase domain-containing protein [Rhodobacter capsulatus]ETD83864.1 ATP synthase [Rhodobacter capsulatus YW1]ETD87363.1 ATP synthase [Rhodobacter capsulatus B6]
MHLDVLDLRDFYYRTQLGRTAQKAIRDKVVELWPDTQSGMAGLTVAGYGFAVPLLRPYLGRARRVIGLMPAQQGVMPWPAGEPNVSVLCAETSWPIETGMIDRLVVLHGLEVSDDPDALMEECWRTLGPGGRALFIVPNRVGLWAPRETTPFGFGRPYTMGQLEAQARRVGFAPERQAAALYIPPSQRRFWLRSSEMWERLGTRAAGYLAAGVVMLEVIKQVHSVRRSGLGAAVRKPLSILEGAPKPVVGRM